VLGGVEICGAGDVVGGRLRGMMGTCGEGGGEGNVVGHCGGGMIDRVKMLWWWGGVWMLRKWGSLPERVYTRKPIV